MSEGSAPGIELTVAGARKRDAGRGIARVPESARSAIGVLSGDPIRIDGDHPTVAKVWPAEMDDAAIRIDADTREAAGVTIGDTVTVRPGTVEAAERVTIQPTSGHTGQESEVGDVKDRVTDRLVEPGQRVHLEGLGSFEVQATTPDEPVRITHDSEITLLPPVEDGNRDSNDESNTPDDAMGERRTGVPDRVTYEDIGGLDEALDRVREMVELPLSDPETFDRLGIRPPSGVLLYGPPGTGKTMIARAVANEVDAHFETISGPEIVSKYKGESEQRLREAFERAAANEPAIVFIDELDSIAAARDDDADMETRVVAQLLTLMDGLEDSGRVVVLGATNRVDAIDPALRRGGRFDREIEIGAPDEAGRREIIDVHTRGMPLAGDVDLDDLATRTHGFVGADIQSLTIEAAMNALGRDREELLVEGNDFEAALAAVDPSAMREYVAESPTLSFADVGGLDDQKRTLREIVQWPLSFGPLFEAAGTDPPTGVLLHGPPGTGKTLLARAVAGESGVNFVHVKGPELLDRYVGESEAAVRNLFERARHAAPSIVFLDEIDALAGKRGESYEATDRVLSQLLTELDRIVDDPTVVVLAATNRFQDLDAALLRPGRLEEHLLVPQPDEAARREILTVHTKGKPLDESVDLDALAARPEGLSGADLAALVRAASMRAIRTVATAIEPEQAAEVVDDVVVTGADFDAAFEDVDSRRRG
jgi:transitional endoplasmic reticulum ATPase